MRIKAKTNCPLDGFKPCRELECAWFMNIRGSNPNTGESVDEWGCAIAWMPVLMIENSQQQRQTGAAVESFRNDMVRSTEVGQQVLLAAVQQNNPHIKVLEVNQ